MMVRVFRVSGLLVFSVLLLGGLARTTPTKTYQDHFRSATLCVADNRLADAIDELTKAVEINPTFVPGYLHRAKNRARVGLFKEALDDYKNVVKLSPGNKDASDALNSQNLSQLDSIRKSALKLMERNDCDQAISKLEQVAAVATSDVAALFGLAHCHYEKNNHQEALVVAGSLLKVDPNHLEGLLLRGNAFHKIGDDELALKHYKKGVQSSPDHKKLLKMRKYVKNLIRFIQSGDEYIAKSMFASAVHSFQDALSLEMQQSAPRDITRKALHLKLCKALSKISKFDEAIHHGRQSVGIDAGNVEAWVALIDALIDGEQYDEASTAAKQAKQHHPQDGSVHQAYQKAELELKKSQRHDFYKILGIRKDATSKQIKRAFRSMAVKYHPDKHVGADTQTVDDMTTKYKLVGQAYEVLIDPETRRRYDAGEDIQEGPQQQQSQHFHFHQGSGFTFTFH